MSQFHQRQDIPCSYETERSVIGAILLDNGCIGDADDLKPEHFHHAIHRMLYSLILEMWSEGCAVDIVTLHNLLDSRKLIAKIPGGIGFIAQLTDGIPPRANMTHYVKILHEKKQLRDIIVASDRAITKALQAEKPEAILKDLEASTVKISSETTVKDADIFLNVEQFTSRYRGDIEWRVDGAIEIGTNGTLVGASGDGKSPAIRALAVCLASGMDWLDLRVKRARTALISREDYPGTTSRFIRRFIDGTGLQASDLRLKDWLYIHSREQKQTLFLDNPPDLRLLINNLKRLKCEFAIFDVLNVLHTKDENDNSEMRKVMSSVDLIRNEVGCQVMILHHAKQAARENNDIVDASRGASAVQGFAEFKWRIKTEDEDEGLRSIRFKVKSGFAHKPIFFKIIDQPNGGVTLERQEPPQKEAKKKRAASAVGD